MKSRSTVFSRLGKYIFFSYFNGQARTFLLVDLRDFFSDLGSEDERKALKMTSQLFIFRVFLISPEQTVKLVK